MITWGIENWGESGLTISLTGLSMTSALGDLAYAAAIEGWGRDAWGDNNWGENESTVFLTGLSATTTLGALIPGWEIWHGIIVSMVGAIHQ